MPYLRKYGVQTTVNFPLIKRDVVDFATSSDYTFASGDCEVKKDEGNGANSTNSPTYEGEGTWSLVLTATEMQAARIVITFIDSATKAIEDQCVIIETFGHASAMFQMDLNDGVRLGLTALPNAAADAAGGLPISDAGGLDLDAQVGTKINDILTDTGTTLQGELDGIQADTEDIQSRLPAALVNSRMDCTIDGTGMESGAVDSILNRDASGSTTNSTLGAIINDWENGGRLDLIIDAAATASALSSLVTTVGVAGAGLTEAGGDGDHLTAINLPNQTMDIVGNITGNLSGSVGSVTGAVGSVTGAVGSVTGAVGSVTGNVGGNVTGSVGSLATQAKADVNAEVLDVLNVDTFAQPGQENPAATTTLGKMLAYLYKAWRNKTTQTSSEYALYADDGTTKDQEAAVSDDGTTTTRGEVGTGA